MNKTWIILFIMIYLSWSCDKNDQSIVKLGERKVSFAITNSVNETWDDAYNLSIEKGINYISIDLDWNQLEPNKDVYKLEILAAIDLLFASDNLPVLLKIHPINQNYSALPEDLEGKALNNSIIINRFKSLLSKVNQATNNANISKICIGNEIDTYLNLEENRWIEYNDFIKNVTPHIKDMWGESIQVSSVITFSAFDSQNEYILESIKNLDFISFTYYPLDNDFTVKNPFTIEADYQKIIDIADKKDIVITECGFPSSDICNSSQALQSDFIKEVFHVWDKKSDQIEAIVFTWLTDYSESQINEIIEELNYGNLPNNLEFKAFLSSLGLRNSDGSPKVAFNTICDEINDRL